MTVETQVAKVTASGNNSATVFSFSPMVIFESSDVEVTWLQANGTSTLLSEGTGTANYSVTVSSYPGTGSITYPASGSGTLATGDTLTIARVLVLQQTVDLENQGGYFPDVQETEFDYLTMLDIQQQEQLDRSVKIPITDTVTTLDDLTADLIAIAADQANLDAVADDLANINSVAGDLADINACAADLTAINAAPAQATAAAASAAAAATSASAAAASVASASFRTIVLLTHSNTPLAPLQVNDGTLYIIDTSGGNFVVNLATISSLTTPYNVSFKKNTSDANTVTINRGGSSDTFDDASTSQTLTANQQGLMIVADSSPNEWGRVPFGVATIGALLASNNLSDVASVSTALTNLGLSNYADLTKNQTFTGTNTLTGGSSALGIIMANAAELATITATGATGVTNFSFTTQSVLYYTTSATANFTLNFRGSSAIPLSSLVSVGQSISGCFLATQGATAFYPSSSNAVQVDGTLVTPKWSGGVTPVAGHASSIDAYLVTLLRTSSSAGGWLALASQTQFK